MKDAAPKSGHPRGCLRNHDPNADRTIVRGDGVCVWDDHGREYIDLTSSYSATNFGHAPVRLIDAAVDQMRTLSLACGLETLGVVNWLTDWSIYPRFLSLRKLGFVRRGLELSKLPGRLPMPFGLVGSCLSNMPIMDAALRRRI